ncbi:MAG: hypothetical protein ABIE75_02870 [Candidatus Omnitrophota bacterium]
MGMDINKTDVLKLLKDDKLVNEVVKKVVDDPEVLDELAEEVAEEMADYLEDDPAIRQKIINAALGSPDFKKRVIKELVDEIGD